MSVGLPVIATDVGGISQLVVDGKTGLLIAPNNVGALSEAILRLSAHPNLRIEMGIKALKHYQQFSSREHALKKLISTYRLVVSHV